MESDKEKGQEVDQARRYRHLSVEFPLYVVGDRTKAHQYSFKLAAENVFGSVEVIIYTICNGHVSHIMSRFVFVILDFFRNDGLRSPNLFWNHFLATLHGP